jgi:hypothetical protein
MLGVSNQSNLNGMFGKHTIKALLDSKVQTML